MTIKSDYAVRDSWEEIQDSPRPAPSFDVTQVIGTVLLSNEDRGMSAYVAAFTLIADHVEACPNGGTFCFPNEDGTTCKVTVEHVD